MFLQVPRVLQVGAQTSKFGFFKLIECIIKKKICHGVKQKIEVFFLGGQRIDQNRKKGWWRERRERIEKGSRERIEIERKETKGN